MKSETLTAVLRCPDCGARHIELRGPVTGEAVVRCANCGGGASPWAEFLEDLTGRITCERRERPGRRVRYRARMHANPTPGWRLILSISLDEFSLPFADRSDRPSSAEGFELLRYAVEVSRVESREGVSASNPQPSGQRGKTAA